MIIGVLADTHIPRRAKQLPGIVLDQMSRVDHIIHAGDICAFSVIENLQKLAPVTAVYGNADTEETKQRLNETELLTLGGVTVGVFHGHGDRGKTPDRALGRFYDRKVDCIVFGHSHIPYCRQHGETLLFNPGSPTDRRRNPYFSFGIIEIGQTLEPSIHYFDGDGRIIAVRTSV